MGFTQTDENQVQCTCGRYYNVGDFCNWCQKTVEQPAEQPEMAEGGQATEPPTMAEGEQAPAPAEEHPEPPAEEQPDEAPPDEEEEPAAAETPPVDPPIATPPPVEGRRSRRER